MEIQAERWKRYGHDRTYLKGMDGAALGWIDNATGALTIEDEANRPALEEWLASNEVAGAPATAPSTTASGPLEQPLAVHSSTTLEDIDLASNRPGQAARQRAQAELESMREQSRFFTGVARILNVKTDERAWRVGANGEETIGGKLEKLTKHGWHVLHAVPVGSRGSDIDHLLIGPGGVWTLNTKNHPGKKVWVSKQKVLVGGYAQPYIRNAEFEADRVRKILRVRLGWEPFVKSALVFLTGTLVPEVTIKSPPEKVVILDRMDVPMVFRRSKGRLDAEQVAAVFEVARRSSTWNG